MLAREPAEREEPLLDPLELARLAAELRQKRSTVPGRLAELRRAPG